MDKELEEELEKQVIYRDQLYPSYKAIYELIGKVHMLKIYRMFHGEALQLPMGLYESKRTAAFLKTLDSDTVDVKELSQTFGYSPRWIKKNLRSDRNE